MSFPKWIPFFMKRKRHVNFTPIAHSLSSKAEQQRNNHLRERLRQQIIKNLIRKRLGTHRPIMFEFERTPLWFWS